MKAVITEGRAVNPGDITWEPATSLVEDMTIYENTTDAEKWERLEGVEIVLTNKVVLDAAVFDRFPQIRYVGVCATGYNNIDIEAARAHGVTVTNVPAYSTASVVQHTFALLLEIVDQISVHSASVKAGDWVASDSFTYLKAPMTELDGKTIGIVGFGDTGHGVAEVARALGMSVIVNTAHPENHAGAPVTFVSLDELFEKSDVISLHCPLTPETEGLICAESITKMRDGVIVLNLARGPLVVEADLAAALESGKVAAFGADVVYKEPMLADNPLLTAPNTVITPHIAWATTEARTRLVDVVAKNLKSWLEGNPENVVS